MAIANLPVMLSTTANTPMSCMTRQRDRERNRERERKKERKDRERNVKKERVRSRDIIALAQSSH